MIHVVTAYCRGRMYPCCLGPDLMLPESQSEVDVEGEKVRSTKANASAQKRR